MAEVNPARIRLARSRRGRSLSELASDCGISRQALGAIENGRSEPKPENLQAIAKATRFPIEYFSQPDPVIPNSESASFRSLSKMSASERDRAIAIGAQAIEVHGWIRQHFATPAPSIPDIRLVPANTAARSVREQWKLGERPIANMIHLLEAKGVRVFSLAGLSRNVDAFSFWNQDAPIVLVNTIKSPEHMRFDMAHELGHLVLHQHGKPQGADIERDANAFASSFLMPEADVVSRVPRNPSLQTLIRMKHIWGVSLIALVHRIAGLGLVSDWISRGLYIEIAKRGYRTDEPESMRKECSQALEKILGHMRSRGGASTIARDTKHSKGDVEDLAFGLATVAVSGGARSGANSVPSQTAKPPHLRVVQ